MIQLTYNIQTLKFPLQIFYIYVYCLYIKFIWNEFAVISCDRLTYEIPFTRCFLTYNWISGNVALFVVTTQGFGCLLKKSLWLPWLEAVKRHQEPWSRSEMNQCQSCFYSNGTHLLWRHRDDCFIFRIHCSVCL